MHEIKELSNILNKYKMVFTDNDWSEIEYYMSRIERKIKEKEFVFDAIKDYEKNERIEDFVTLKYAAKLSGFSEVTIRKWANEGKIDFIYLGCQRLVNLESLEKYLGGREDGKMGNNSRSS